MSFIDHIWPWSRFNDYEWRLKERQQRIEDLKTQVEFHLNGHISLMDKFQKEREQHEIAKNGLRHIATTLAIRGGFDKLSLIIIFLMVCFSGLCQPVKPTWLTTNATPLLSATAGPFVAGPNTVHPFLSFNGGSITNIDTNGWTANAFNWVLNTISNASLNATNEALRQATSITNGAINNISNWVNTITSQSTSNFGIGQISFTIDGGGLPVATNKSFWVRVPWNGSILCATLLTDVSGNVGLDVWKTNYAQYPPLVANTIVASAPPAMAAAVKYQDKTLTGWQKTFVTNDVFKFIIYSNSAATQITLNLDVIKQ